MKNKIVNPLNRAYRSNRVTGRGTTFFGLNHQGSYRGLSLKTFGSSYKGFRIVLSKRIYEL